MRSSTCLAFGLSGILVLTLAILGRAEGPVVEQAASKPPPAVAGFDVGRLPVGKTIAHSAGEARIRDVLEMPADFDLNEVRLGNFVAQLAEKHRIGVVIDEEPLRSDGKGADTLLSAKLRDVPLGSALRSILKNCGLTFVVCDELVVITTITEASSRFTTRVYQVHDLVMIPEDPSRRPDFESLIELISSTVQVESWIDAGGTIGEYKHFNGPGIIVLVITHTEGVHRQIESLLADLRAAKIPAVLELQRRRSPKR